MEPVFILRFLRCWVNESLWLLLDGTLIHRRLAPTRHWYSFTYPGRMESWVNLGGKNGQNRGSNLYKPCSRKAEILPTVPTTPTQGCITHVQILGYQCLVLCLAQIHISKSRRKVSELQNTNFWKHFRTSNDFRTWNFIKSSKLICIFEGLELCINVGNSLFSIWIQKYFVRPDEIRPCLYGAELPLVEEPPV